MAIFGLNGYPVNISIRRKWGRRNWVDLDLYGQNIQFETQRQVAQFIKKLTIAASRLDPK